MENKIITTTENEKLKGKINVDGDIYKIFTCKKLMVSNHYTAGFLDNERKIIYLKKDKNIKATFLHELLHIFLYKTHLKAKKNKRIIKKLISDEFFVENLTRLVYKFTNFFK